MRVFLTVIALMMAWAPAAMADSDLAKFESPLVRCADLSPAGPALTCGTDALLAGHAEIGPSGAIEVEVAGAAADASYDVLLRAVTGGTQLFLGTLATDAAGNGELKVVGPFTAGTVGAGDIVLIRLGVVQFVSGFQVAATADKKGENENEDEDEAGFQAALVRCADVTVPAALVGCGTDPLLAGEAEIDAEGNVEVEVAGATPNASYTVVFRSLNGAPPVTLGTLSTDGAGNGELEVSGAFAPDAVRAGAVVLQRTGLDQFVTGFRVLGIRPRKLEAAVVRCADVTQPGTLDPCGTDSLETGHLQVRLDGRIKAEIVHAVPRSSYTLVLRSLDGSTDLVLGTLATNPAGNGQLKVSGAFIPSDVGAGTFVFRREDADQFVSGFRVHGKHTRRFEAGLVRCADVNQPAPALACGSDPLLTGDASIRGDGRVTVEVVAAMPSESYDVVLRSMTGTELALGTLATDAAGNGRLRLDGAFASGDIGSGNLVLIRAGVDQFVTGFRVQAADVPDAHWAKPSIEGLFVSRITRGCAEDPLLYCPDASVNRAQMAVFLLRGRHGAGFQPAPATGRFGDVAMGYWAAAWIEALAGEGLTAGCGGPQFCPDAPVSRAEMAVFLLRARHGADYVPPTPTGLFGDVPASHWAAAWIEALAGEGITAGCQPGTYCPEAPVTRAQMAVFLLRAFGP
jgi:hypothetical protein